MKIKSLLLIGSMAVVGLAISSCSKEENLFDSEAAQANRLEQYKANLEALIQQRSSDSEDKQTRFLLQRGFTYEEIISKSRDNIHSIL